MFDFDFFKKPRIKGSLILKLPFFLKSRTSGYLKIQITIQHWSLPTHLPRYLPYLPTSLPTYPPKFFPIFSFKLLVGMEKREAKYPRNSDPVSTARTVRGPRFHVSGWPRVNATANVSPCSVNGAQAQEKPLKRSAKYPRNSKPVSTAPVPFVSQASRQKPMEKQPQCVIIAV